METFDFIPIAAATLAGFIFGAIWYGVLGKPWMQAAGLNPEDTKPSPVLFALTFVCQLVIATVLAGIIHNSGSVSLTSGLTTGALVWAGFVATTMIVNHRFQGQKWSLTLIDAGHWLGGLLIQGGIIGSMGAA